jgi:hypothetical protein
LQDATHAVDRIAVGTLAEQAAREKTTHLAYLEALLTARWKSAKRTRLIGESRKHDYHE